MKFSIEFYKYKDVFFILSGRNGKMANLLEVVMKNSQSKFSNEKSKSNPDSKSSSATSGCCCGSKMSDDIDEVDIIDVEEK